MNREVLQSDVSAGAERERAYPSGLTVRKITMAEELLISRAGLSVLTLPFLSRIASEKATEEDVVEIAKATFICCTPAEATRATLRSGSDALDAAFIAFLSAADRAEFAEASAFVMKSVAEIAAAHFRIVSESGGSVKNAPFPEGGRS